jgi:hypothetical protein
MKCSATKIADMDRFITVDGAETICAMRSDGWYWWQAGGRRFVRVLRSVPAGMGFDTQHMHSSAPISADMNGFIGVDGTTTLRAIRSYVR